MIIDQYQPVSEDGDFTNLLKCLEYAMMAL